MHELAQTLMRDEDGSSHKPQHNSTDGAMFMPCGVLLTPPDLYWRESLVPVHVQKTRWARED